MKTSFFAGCLALIMMVCMAQGEVLYTNDFGTQSQLNGFSWVTDYGAGINGITRCGTGSGVVDLDGDGLYEMVAQSTDDVGFGGSTGTVIIYAPLFCKMTITSASAYLAGTPSWSTAATLELSGDGVHYLSVSDDDTNILKQYTLIPDAGDPNFIETDKVWLRLKLNSGNHNIPSYYWGRTAAIQLQGTVISGGIGDHVTIFSNDLGTDAQASEWMVSGFVERQDYSGYDTDADGLSGRFFRYQSGQSWALTKVKAPFGLAFAYPVGQCVGYRNTSQGSGSSISISLNGKDWISSSYGAGAGAIALTADSSGQDGWDAVEEFWLYVGLNGTNSLPDYYQPWINSIVCHADLVAAPHHHCGEEGTVYLQGDITGVNGVPDCYVDMLDLVGMSADWLEQNDPYVP